MIKPVCCMLAAAMFCMAAADKVGDSTATVVHHLNPDTLVKQEHATQIVRIRNPRDLVHIAGQTAVNTKFEVVGSSLQEQTVEALKNLDFALEAAKCKRHSLVSLRVFFVSNNAAEIRTLQGMLKTYFKGGPLPALTLIGVTRLVGDGMLVEIEGTAHLQDARP
jgi:enamine deaminase RidA (YjgF/YER057c/UK114 family)